MATNPSVPRAKAIARAPLSHQFVIAVPATTLRKPTMVLIEGSRCSQTHSPMTAVSREVAQVTGCVHPLASDGGPIELPPGQSKAKLERMDG
jgi:hypothetical protein